MQQCDTCTAEAPSIALSHSHNSSQKCLLASMSRLIACAAFRVLPSAVLPRMLTALILPPRCVNASGKAGTNGNQHLCGKVPDHLPACVADLLIGIRFLSPFYDGRLCCKSWCGNKAVNATSGYSAGCSTRACCAQALVSFPKRRFSVQRERGGASWPSCGALADPILPFRSLVSAAILHKLFVTYFCSRCRT